MEKEKNYSHVVHNFEPVYNAESRVLILGSFPSVKSREQNFYYGHPQNRFWKVIAQLTGWSVPVTVEEKKKMLLENRIAIWDVIASCDIIGSSDSSIKNVVVNDFESVLHCSKIQKIYANGAKAYDLYQKYAPEPLCQKIMKLPSTSPANAAWSIERLCEAWEGILQDTGVGGGRNTISHEGTKERPGDTSDGMLGRISGFLLQNANPSIVYHVKNDILKNIMEDDKRELQDRILQEKIIQDIIACQKESGWLGNGFHGANKNAGQYENQEVGVKYLGEKLVYKDTPVLKNAIGAFKTVFPRLFGEYDTDCNRYAASGSDIIKAACVARAGYEDSFDITKEITSALESFGRVTEIESVTDIVKIRKRRPERSNPEGIAYVFNNYEKWPCWYHLDILAHTDSWRTSENIAMLADAFNKLLKDMGFDYQPAYCVDIGHLVGCCGAFKEGMKLSTETGGEHYVFLNLVEYMCRCGLYSLVPSLKKEVDIIYASIDGQGICRANYSEKALKGMGCYSGGQLEVDWRSKTRKLCDVTYRGLLILYYSGLLTC